MLNLKNLFRPPETKTSRTAQVLAFESGGRARWSPRDYAALAREGYLANAIVHRSVRLVAENAASCAFLLYEGAHERDDHPLLRLITRPNARQDGASFFEALYAHMLLAGNAYVEAVALDGEVRELYALRPDRMKVVPGADGWAEAYESSVGGRSVRFDQAAFPWLFRTASARRPVSSAIRSNRVSKVATPAVTERNSTMRSPISACGMVASTTSQPGHCGRAS